MIARKEKILPEFEKEALDLNVVLFPDQSTRKQLIDFSAKLTSLADTDYSLAIPGYPPHISLYSALYPRKNTDMLIERLSSILQETKRFEILLHGYTNFSGGYIFLNAVQNDNLRILHEAVVDTLNPLREGMISEDQTRLTGLTFEQKEKIRLYGYLSVKDNYIPHVTLGHVKDQERAEQVIAELPDRSITFISHQVALVPFDLSDRMQSPLASVLLGQS